MKTFLTQHAEQIKGTLSGFDRVRFRGTLRWLANTKGLMSWLWRAKVLLKDFKEYSIGLTNWTAPGFVFCLAVSRDSG